MKRFLLLLAIVGVVSGCYNDKAQNLYPANSNDSCSVTAVSFAATVQPIIAQNCAIGGCHDATSTTGYILTTYSNIQAQATNGQLVGSISHTGNYPAMPLSGALTTCQIKQITAWVNDGAKNN